MNALLDSDTLLVDTSEHFNEYKEALLAPPIRFWLIGNVSADTGHYLRPTIDATLAADTLHRGDLLLPANSFATVERMCFRNRLPMPAGEGAGGVTVQADSAAFYDCLFDSTRAGVYKSYDDPYGYVLLDHCAFRYNDGYAVFQLSGPVSAYDCAFEGRLEPAGTFYQLACGAGSIVERCHFSGTASHAFGNFGKPNITVRDCIFGPDTLAEWQYVELIDFVGVFENNLFTGLRLYSPVMTATVDCRYQSIFRRNEFYDCGNRQSSGMANHLLDITCSEDQNTDTFYVVEENVMAFCSTNADAASGIRASGEGRFVRNRIHDLFPGDHDAWAVTIYGEAAMTFQDNLIYHNEFGLRNTSNHAVDARFNWWGDSTGPYHPTLNPDGLGDQVEGEADFVPWLEDSLLASAPTPPLALPESFGLEAYPNPFNATARLRLVPAGPQIVTVELFDVLGRKVQDVWRGPLAFHKEITVNGAELASGVYFARVTNSIFRRPLATAKLVLLK